MSNSVPIEAVVLTWNSAHEIERCLRTMAAGMRNFGGGSVIHVVDNGSTDGTRELVEALNNEIGYVKIRCHSMGHNTGTTVSRNFALKLVKAPLVLIADSDTEFLPGAIEDLAARMAERSDAALIAPQLYLPDGNKQENCRRFPTIKTKILRTLVARTGVGEKLRQRDESYALGTLREVDYAISACWLLRSAAMEHIGLLDEKIFYSPEDADFCLRLRRGGWKVVWEREVQIIHHTKRLSHKGFFNFFARSHTRGLRYFWRKHGFSWRRASLYSTFPEAPLVAVKPLLPEPGNAESPSVVAGQVVDANC